MGTEPNVKANPAPLMSKSAILALLLWGTTSTFAFWPPLQDVEAGKETMGSTTTVRYKVFDPVLNEWKEGNKSYNGYSVQLISTDGVVAWLARKGSDYLIGYAVYDPGRQKWQEGAQNYSSDGGHSYTVSQLKNDDGVICWLVSHTYVDPDLPDFVDRSKNVQYALYDPEIAAWQKWTSYHWEFEAQSYSGFQLKTLDGVVAWTATLTDTLGPVPYVTYVVGSVVYDPALKSWQGGPSTYNNQISSLVIQDATVHYQEGGTYHIHGYDASAGSWYNGPTKPLAYFAANPTLGLVPSTVWFTDMSIGATSWEWDFGDGGRSSERSPFHIFSDCGDFSVIQTVTGPQGSDSKVFSITAWRDFAYLPSPPDGATDVSCDVILSWMPGVFAKEHNVYVGTIFKDVNAASTENPLGVLVSLGQDANMYEPGLLEFDRTYYWRVDEVNAPPDSTVFKGDIWSFTTIKASQIIYVDGDATGANDGTSWVNAYRYLQDALADANSSDAPIEEIRVAGGVYKPDRGRAIARGDREATFHLIDGVPLKGGYAGVSEPDTNARDTIAYETILSGDLNGNDVDVNDPRQLLDEPTRNDNSYHVVTCTGTNMTIEGFTISAGHANGQISIYQKRGGGLYDGSPTVTNCAFIGNSAEDWGGGLYAKSPRITDCTFSGNSADVGGGLSLREGDSNLTTCTFSGNSANYGGGLDMWDEWYARLTLTNCTFYGNLARENGGGLITGKHTTVSLTECTFSNNTALGEESFTGGGGLYNVGDCYLKAINCTFGGNRAYNGGGMYNDDGDPELINCTFSWNTAHLSGGGLYNSGAVIPRPRLRNCTFGGNRAGKGGGMYNYYSSPIVENCTFSQNSATLGGAGMYNEHWNPWLINCILWNDGEEIGNLDVPAITAVEYSNVRGGWPGWGNIDADPLFANLGYWDPNGTPEDTGDDFWVGGNYHLKSRAGRWDPINQTWVIDDVTSPCIDAGKPSYRVGNEPQPNGGRINMGAYGGTAEASKSP